MASTYRMCNSSILTLMEEGKPSLNPGADSEDQPLRVRLVNVRDWRGAYPLLHSVDNRHRRPSSCFFSQPSVEFSQLLQLCLLLIMRLGMRSKINLLHVTL